jgi:hypothetical protein
MMLEGGSERGRISWLPGTNKPLWGPTKVNDTDRNQLSSENSFGAEVVLGQESRQVILGQGGAFTHCQLEFI